MRHLLVNALLTIGVIVMALPGAVCAQSESEAKDSPMTSRAQQLMGATAPKLAELTDNVLYADVWERPELSKRDRSLITVAALVAMNRPDQLRSHLGIALQNGLTKEELSETITHLAFYGGWPNAVTAVGVAKEVFEQNDGAAATREITVLRAGSQPATQGPASNFTGAVKVESRFQADAPARIGGGLVTFQTGARTAWHTHPLGQTLIVTEGEGLVQQWEGEVLPIKAGDVVSIPAGVKHWHGAAEAAAMAHIAITEASGGKSTDWMEQVSDEDHSR